MQWRGDPALRPLAPAGEHQAARLPDLLGAGDLTRVLSSPALRCVATITPLATKIGVPIEQTPALAEGNAERAVALLAAWDGSTQAWCTHGDVIPVLLDHLAAAGVTVPWRRRWEPCSAWLLHREGGTIVRATYVAPPRPEA